MAPEVLEDEVAELAVMIPQHHSLFARLYSASSLIPKHHFMIHMPRLILKQVSVHVGNNGKSKLVMYHM